MTTPNYGFNLPVPESPMSDVTDAFNNAFTTMRSFVQPNRGTVAGSVLPQKSSGPSAGDYQVGDVIHLAGWKSNFILIGYDPLVSGAYWGYIWRPIQAAWGPWVPVQSPATYVDSTKFTSSVNNPLQYRISNTGEWEFSGGCRSFTTVDTPWPKWTGGTDRQVLAPLPVNCRPAINTLFTLTLVNPDLAATNKPYQFAYGVLVRSTGGIGFRVFNDSVLNAGTATEVHMNNVLWPMATRTDLVGN